MAGDLGTPRSRRIRAPREEAVAASAECPGKGGRDLEDRLARGPGQRSDLGDGLSLLF